MDNEVYLVKLPELFNLFLCTSKHSFSALCRVKIYLRSTMMQEQLNHLLVLQERTDAVDLKNIGEKFVAGCLGTFGKVQIAASYFTSLAVSLTYMHVNNYSSAASSRYYTSI